MNRVSTLFEAFTLELFVYIFDIQVCSFQTQFASFSEVVDDQSIVLGQNYYLLMKILTY